MVISFSESHARRQLRESGAVVTFRTEERARTPRYGAQETWANAGRGEEKLFDVEVRHIAEVVPRSATLRGYYRLSGFPSVRSWSEAIVRLHGSRPENGHLYLVTRRDEP